MCFVFWLYSNFRSFWQKAFKQALNNALWNTTISDQITIYLPLYYPFLKPNKSIFIFYDFIIPLKDEAALFAFKALFTYLCTPSNYFKTVTNPARFFLLYYRNWKGFQFTSLKPFAWLNLKCFYKIFLM